MAAPAPSPNNTQVPLSVQSIILESVSAPIIRACLINPEQMKAWAVCNPYINPVQAAFIS